MIILKIYWHLVAAVKMHIYKLIFRSRVTFGKGCTFRSGFGILVNKNAKVIIGDGVFFNKRCSIVALERIEIGDDCIFGENVKLYDHNHCFSQKNTLIKKQGFKSCPISIGANCWIANDVIILKGVRIGENTVIGAGCIIKNDIPANSVVTNSSENVITKTLYKL